MAKRKQREIAGDKTICLPIADEIDYEQLVEDRDACRQYLDKQNSIPSRTVPQGL